MPGYRSELICKSCKGKFPRLEIKANSGFCDPCSSRTKLCDCECGEYIPAYTSLGGIRKTKNNKHVTRATRHIVSAANKGKIMTLETRHKISEGLMGRVISKEHRDNLVLASERRWNRPEEHTKTRNSMKTYYKHHAGSNKGRKFPEEFGIAVSKSLAGRKLTSKHKSRLSEALKIRLADPRNHPNWQGGKSFEKYDGRFTPEFKRKIRSRQDNVCADRKYNNCSNESRELQVHHIDGNKKNTVMENCIAICLTHHNKIRGSRIKSIRVRHLQYLDQFVV